MWFVQDVPGRMRTLLPYTRAVGSWDHFRSLQITSDVFFFRKEFWSARYKEKSVENELSGRLPEAQQKLSKETKRNLETEKRFNV